MITWTTLFLTSPQFFKTYLKSMIQDLSHKLRLSKNIYPCSWQKVIFIYQIEQKAEHRSKTSLGCSDPVFKWHVELPVAVFLFLHYSKLFFTSFSLLFSTPLLWFFFFLHLFLSFSAFLFIPWYLLSLFFIIVSNG